jgi:hypothetical protein
VGDWLIFVDADSQPSPCFGTSRRPCPPAATSPAAALCGSKPTAIFGAS